jgi:hypothetical protein
MQHPDEGMIHTWLDGELPVEEAAALEKHISECPECSAKVAEARGLVAASSRIVSSLDIIPGGVIPAAQPKRRAWYASTQLRAAAAVIIVAGASLVVMRGRGGESMDKMMAVSPSVRQAEVLQDTAAAGSGATAQSASAPASSIESRIATTSREDTRVGQTASKAMQKKPTANEAAPVLSPSPVAVDENAAATRRAFAKPSEPGLRASMADSLKRAESPLIQNVVVTGAQEAVSGRVAGVTAAPEFQKIRADTVGAVRHTVFATPGGVQVTLTDTDLKSSLAQRTRSKESADASAASAPPAVPAPAPQPTAVSSMPRMVLNTITWTDKRGHRMVLQGYVAKEKLEELRKTLPEDQR